MSKVNKFFDKVFVINLYDKTARWNKVNSQLKRRKIKAERFIAVDGRCKDQGRAGCIAKLKSFEIAYNLKISVPRGTTLQELVPASSLTIGTILLLRAMVKNKWKRILILEDDVELCRNFEKKFTQGIKSIGKKKWDLLYLGCGNKCGHRDIGTFDDKGKNLNKISTISKVLKSSPEDSIYVRYKNDLRNPCEVVECSAVTPNISHAPSPGGTWAYGITLKGAKKVLKIIGKDVGVHIDQVYKDYCDTSTLNCVAFDPPVIWHQDGYFRTDTDIPWLD
jgi:GR25 family glycosyltransferase involved in LPS biosynthesis